MWYETSELKSLAAVFDRHESVFDDEAFVVRARRAVAVIASCPKYCSEKSPVTMESPGSATSAGTSKVGKRSGRRRRRTTATCALWRRTAIWTMSITIYLVITGPRVVVAGPPPFRGRG
jgi:hypothetical protein